MLGFLGIIISKVDTETPYQLEFARLPRLKERAYK
jgi:hypothetical protein